MDAMHKIDVLSETKATTYRMKGERMFVDGRQMVRMSHGTIVPADGWFPSIREARLSAAAKLSEIARAIAAQAEELRDCAEDPE